MWLLYRRFGPGVTTSGPLPARHRPSPGGLWRHGERNSGSIFDPNAQIDNGRTIHDDLPARWQVADIHHHSLRNLSTNFAASPKQPRAEPRRALNFGPCGRAFDIGTTAAYGTPRLVTTVTVPSLLAARRIAAKLALTSLTPAVWILSCIPFLSMTQTMVHGHSFHGSEFARMSERTAYRLNRPTSVEPNPNTTRRTRVYALVGQHCELKRGTKPTRVRKGAGIAPIARERRVDAPL